jgi:hypothetical protein
MSTTGVVVFVDVVGDLGPFVDDLGGAVAARGHVGDLEDGGNVSVDGDPRLGGEADEVAPS